MLTPPERIDFFMELLGCKTQKELAEHLQATPQTISNYLNKTKPSIEGKMLDVLIEREKMRNRSPGT